MKTTLILLFVLASLNTTAQKYVFSDRDCDINLVVKYNEKRDKANLKLDLTNKGDLSIFSQFRFIAQWDVNKDGLLILFGDNYKFWREDDYVLTQVKPRETVHFDIWVDNHFTDSTTVTFGGGMLTVPTPKERKTFTNRDFQDRTQFKNFGFVFYPTYRDGVKKSEE